MIADLPTRSLGDLQALHPGIAHVLRLADPSEPKPDMDFASWLETLDLTKLNRAGLSIENLCTHVETLVRQSETLRGPLDFSLKALSLIAGVDKFGGAEAFDLEIAVGEIVCIVGPTGSGKSRLLADIECLAQGDTPSKRKVLINGAKPDPTLRFGSNHGLIAQVSQNMNFVMDLGVGEFLTMHAECRQATDADGVVADVIACGNELAGERFTAETPLTQLSGGQSRALMIADTALLSASPIVLIDEIENAGIDRRRALDLLVAREKIVLISTHDPILALMGDKRVVIRHGAIAKIIQTSARERACLVELQRLDARFTEVRQRLRVGETIDDEKI